LFDFVAMRVQHYYFWIYSHNQTNTFRLNGSLTTQMFNKKDQMAFDTLQVEAIEGLLSFTNTIGHGQP